MRFHRATPLHMNSRLVLAGCFASAILGASGCTTLGPVSVPEDRFDYNKVLAQSSEQQLLLNLVRLRYGEPVQWVAVSSMISKYTLQGEAGWSQWYNNMHVFENPALRGILGGVDATPNRQNTWNTQAHYSDSPTITYAPVEGEEFSKRVLTPIPISIVLYLIQAGWPVDQVFECCLQRINDLDNAGPRTTSRPAQDTADVSPFEKVTRRMRQYQETGDFTFRLAAEKDKQQLYAVRRMDLTMNAERIELSRQLGLRPEATRIRIIQAPFPGDAPDTLCLQTRSLLGILQALAHGVEAPAGDIASGKATGPEDFVYAVKPSRWLDVHSSPVPVCGAFVQVNYHGRWFYIEDSNVPSKQTMSLLTYLYALQGTDVSAKSPILTIQAGS